MQKSLAFRKLKRYTTKEQEVIIKSIPGGNEDVICR